MQLFFAGICFFGLVVGIIFVKSQDLGAWLTIAIIVPLVILVVFSLARIQSKKPQTEKDTKKITRR